MLQNIMNNKAEIKDLKELEKNIDCTDAVDRIKKNFKSIPSDSNEFSKIISYGDTTFLFDVDKQESVEHLIFTDDELEDVSRDDYIKCITFAYAWVYGFKDYEGIHKTTPNVPSLDFKLNNKKVKQFLKKDTTCVETTLELAGFDLESQKKLSEWEKTLVIKETWNLIHSPSKSSLGFLQRN